MRSSRAPLPIGYGGAKPTVHTGTKTPRKNMASHKRWCMQQKSCKRQSTPKTCHTQTQQEPGKSAGCTQAPTQPEKKQAKPSVAVPSSGTWCTQAPSEKVQPTQRGPIVETGGGSRTHRSIRSIGGKAVSVRVLVMGVSVIRVLVDCFCCKGFDQ